jgi:predicted flap endonuclease-1-like 5' DNA nuclease
MSDDLKSDLQEISGIGPATADDILAILPDESGEHDPYIDKALEAAREGNDRQAVVYLKRAAGGE